MKVKRKSVDVFMDRTKDAERATWIGFVINLLLSIFKLAAGILGNSSAMVADSMHSFSDIGSDLADLFGIKASDRPRDDSHDFGHGKFETLVTLLIGLLLVGVAAGIVISAGTKLYDFMRGYDVPRPGILAAAAAFVSIVLKEGTYRYTMLVARRTNSKALEANAWHHRTDSLSSIGVLLGIGGAILLGGKWTVLDPVAAVLVSILIFWISGKLVYGSVMELTEASLDDVTERKILSIISSVKGAEDPHNLRTRRIGPYIAIDVHVRAPGDISLNSSHDISVRVEDALKGEFGFETIVNVHMDPMHV